MVATPTRMKIINDRENGMNVIDSSMHERT